MREGEIRDMMGLVDEGRAISEAKVLSICMGLVL